MLETLLSISVLIAAILAVVRAAQVRFIRREFRKPFPDIPEELQAVWAENRIWKFASANAVEGAGVGINTGQTLYHLSRIDPKVLKAIDRIKDPSRVMSYRKLLSHLAKKRGDGEASWQGSISNYKGAVGEDLIMEQLLAQGHHVELAESTTQEEWDALVDGQPYNFKVGLNPSGIQEHLERFPDIPVYTVVEHSELFADNPDVICLDGISGVEIEEVTREAMESALEMGDLGFELPVVTFALASFRNFTPVFAGHSGISTATRNTVVDTFGSGLGLAAGAKAGGIIGSLGGPLGAGAGAIIGGIAGAIGGKLAAKGIKEKELRQAKSDLGESLEQYGKAYLHGLRYKAEALEESAKQMRGRLNLWHLIAPTPGDIVRGDIRHGYRNWARHCRNLYRDLPDLHRVEPAPGQKRGPVDFRSIAETVVAGEVDEPVQNSEIGRCVFRLKEAIEAVRAEHRRLGYEK